jgi:hypothetical protein
MRVRLESIEEPQNLGLYELRHLYKSNVCGTICDYALSLMTLHELKRYVARGIYKESVKFKKRQRTFIIEKLTLLLGLSHRTIEKLCPSNKTKKQKQDETTD